MTNQIRNLLERPKVRDAIVKEVSSFWQGNSESLQQTEEVFDSLQKNAWTAMLRHSSLARINSVWHEQIAPELRLPAALTIRDFSTAVATMFFSTATDPQLTYDSFANFLASAVTVHRRSRPISVVIGQFIADPNLQELMWRSETDFKVTLLGGLPIQDEHFGGEAQNSSFTVTSPYAIYVRIEGRCSSNAFRRFRREIFQVMRCVFRSLSLVKTFNHFVRSVIPWQDKVRLGDHSNTLGDGPINSDDLCVAPLLNAYFSNPTKRDSFDRRIRNSLHLLVQSDQQRHTAIGIALSVAAIESLVCRKAGDIANMFAENTAVILEPDPTFRAAAVEFVKDLYDARSRVLHGDLLEHEATMRRNARALAAAVLQAILERRAFQRRAGVQSETPDDLINELRRGKWVPGQLTGVSESPVRTLWGARYEGPTLETDDESTDQESESDE